MKFLIFTILSFAAASVSLCSEPVPVSVYLNLKEPPPDAKLGKAHLGVQIGLWTERATYEGEEIRNVWIIARMVSRKLKGSPITIGVGGSLYKNSTLYISQNGKVVKKFPIDGGRDGVKDALEFSGGISSKLSKLPAGSYDLIWKAGKHESNVIRVTIK